MSPLDLFLPGIGSFIQDLVDGGKNGTPAEGLNSPSSWWDKFKNGNTNDVNKGIADENLEYQRERNAIEDARYEEETAYNRAFAEDERAYNRAFTEEEQAYNRAFAENERAYQRAFSAEEQAYNRRFAEETRDYERALQQQIFEREDTAISRQASELAKLGINPLSQNMNGLGSGAVVSSTVPSNQVSGSSGYSSMSPSGTSAPSASDRGGSPLHNDFKMQDVGVFGALSPLLSFAETLNGVASGEYQRDSLALANDAQYLANLEKAHELGIQYRGYMPDRAGSKNYRKSHLYFTDEDSGTELADEYYWKESNQSKLMQKSYEADNAQFKKRNRLFDYPQNKFNTLNILGSGDLEYAAEQALSQGSKLFEQSFNKLFDKNNAETIYDLGKDNKGHFNPFNMLMNLFF